MNRTELKRKTRLRDAPLRPGTKPLARKTRMKSGAPPRATGRPSQRFAKRRDPEYCAWIRTLTCPFNRERMRFDPPESEIGWILFHKDCGGPVECAHVVSRGAGGDDRGNTIPLCRKHHREQHDKGMESFQRLYGFDLAAIATQLEARWVRQQEEA